MKSMQEAALAALFAQLRVVRLSLRAVRNPAATAALKRATAAALEIRKALREGGQ